MSVCVFRMYPAIESGDHKGKCGCVLKMYSAILSGDHEGKSFCVCAEDISFYGIW